MNIVKHKITLLFTIIAVVAALLTASYYSYLSYEKYTAVEKEESTSSFLYELESVLHKIELERVRSVIYLASQSINNLKRLKETRDEVDFSLMSFNSFVRDTRAYTPYTQEMEVIFEALKRVREEVDHVSHAYIDILFDAYHVKIVSALLAIVQEIAGVQNSGQLKNYLLIYKAYATLQENSVLEHSLIYFMLLAEKKMSHEDISLWKQLIDKDTLPTNLLSNMPIRLEIDALLTADEFYAFVSREREMILSQARRGEYSVSAVGWRNKINTKTEYFKKVTSLIHTGIQQTEQKIIFRSKRTVLWYGLALLLLLLLLFRLIRVYADINRDQKISKETLEDIKLIFNQNQQEEIQRLIKQGKVDHIYKFLIQAIKDGNQTKDLFLASMSHEIRTPLNGILGFTQLLKESDSKEEREEFISVIEKSGANLLTIVNDILDLSKIKAEKIELETIEFDPIDSFEAAVESYAAKAAEESIDFNIFLDPNLPTLLIGDPTKISQVIVNLISNAIKFTSKNGEVNVSIENLSESDETVKVQFTVSDTGIGITKEQKENLFKAFSQADISTSRKYGGTGLGLSISGKLIDLMGGKINIRSVPNEGSSFYFTLSFNKPATAHKREVADMSRYTVGILNPHIDEEYFINKNLEAYLLYTGARIKRYTDESLLALKGSSNLPDILFIDHKFRYRGDELKKFLGLDTKIILISTGDQKRNLKRYQSLIHRIIYKPINFTKTLKILDENEEISDTKKTILFDNVHVLVAEDNLINQKLIDHVLRKFGIEVSIVNNGQEALEHRMLYEYDMIFMDIQMPVMGGMEATGNILSYERSNTKTHIPIVALTANALSGDKVKYLSAGMDGYLSKPIELESLKVLLEEYFEERIID
ncbi:MAG: ATP-binding protein [Campylobacterota bacterium]|nr:ATP-binding protein [Campylobacterota bacterium]